MYPAYLYLLDVTSYFEGSFLPFRPSELNIHSRLPIYDSVS